MWNAGGTKMKISMPKKKIVLEPENEIDHFWLGIITERILCTLIETGDNEDRKISIEINPSTLINYLTKPQ